MHVFSGHHYACIQWAPPCIIQGAHHYACIQGQQQSAIKGTPTCTSEDE